jgi:DHA1 family bicyclomycin/chloramphenicol resistance-like MFS transporter
VSETGFLWLFGPSTAGIVAGAWLSGRFAESWSRRQTVWWAYGIMTIAALGNVALNLLVPPGLPWSVAPIFVYFTGSALAMPSLTLMALDLFPEQRGLAASCQNFVQTAGNAIATALIAPLVWGSTLTLALGMAIMLAVGLSAFAIHQLPARADART